MVKQDNLKNISVSVSNDCWKKLKIYSIQKEISLGDAVKEVLEKFCSKKSITNEMVVED